MMVKEGITNVAVVITRYFGGIKLGTGGLVRAYTNSAKLGLKDGILCDVVSKKSITYVTDYTYLDKIKSIEKEGLFNIEDTSYSEKVKIELVCNEEDEIKMKEIIESLTNGTCKIVNEKNILVKLPRKS
jgi:putative IMPACT (imprinted ancient) family translation regulator